MTPSQNLPEWERRWIHDDDASNLGLARGTQAAINLLDAEPVIPDDDGVSLVALLIGAGMILGAVWVWW